jgi:hypothetical protein
MENPVFEIGSHVLEQNEDVVVPIVLPSYTRPNIKALCKRMFWFGFSIVRVVTFSFVVTGTVLGIGSACVLFVSKKLRLD